MHPVSKAVVFISSSNEVVGMTVCPRYSHLFFLFFFDSFIALILVIQFRSCAVIMIFELNVFLLLPICVKPDSYKLPTILIICISLIPFYVSQLCHRPRCNFSLQFILSFENHCCSFIYITIF